MIQGPDESEIVKSLVEEPDLVSGFLAAVHRAQSGDRLRPFSTPYHPSSDVAELPIRGSSGGVEAAARTGLDAARMLAEAVRHGSITDRRQAHVAIADIIHTLVEPYDGRVVSQPRAFATLGLVEEQLRRLRSKAPRLRWSPTLTRPWTVVGFAISLVAAAGIVSGHFSLAAALIVARTAISLTMATPGFASDTRGRAEWSVDWRACVVGQLTDALALSALSGYLLVNGDRTWGLLTAMVPLVSLGATLLRLAAAQGGVVLGRLYIERVARNGVLVAGLMLAAFAGSANAGGAVLAVVLASSGAAAFAFVETVRTLVYAAQRQTLDRLNGTHEAFAKRVANVVPLVDAMVDAVPSARPGDLAA